MPYKRLNPDERPVYLVFKEFAVEKTKKIPLLAGLLNMLVPGSIHIYIRKK
jgi:hypothetical protein